MEANAFRTPDGDSVTAVTAGEMRDVDRVAVDEFGIEVLQILDILEAWPFGDEFSVTLSPSAYPHRN